MMDTPGALEGCKSEGAQGGREEPGAKAGPSAAPGPEPPDSLS